ncbi:E3 ubiquitin-protein ligase pellino 2 [Phlyctochytrium bullatum]|nr:E3 ubiquitin-protein ligase pellino 2 [Phlyctochytrium bullatum]
MASRVEAMPRLPHSASPPTIMFLDDTSNAPVADVDTNATGTDTDSSSTAVPTSSNGTLLASTSIHTSTPAPSPSQPIDIPGQRRTTLDTDIDLRLHHGTMPTPGAELSIHIPSIPRPTSLSTTPIASLQLSHPTATSSHPPPPPLQLVTPPLSPSSGTIQASPTALTPTTPTSRLTDQIRRTRSDLAVTFSPEVSSPPRFPPSAEGSTVAGGAGTALLTQTGAEETLSTSAPSILGTQIHPKLGVARGNLLRRRSSLGNEESGVLYGKLVVLGYQASVTALAANGDGDPQKVLTLREGGNHTFLLHRRPQPNGYKLPAPPDAPDLLSSFMFKLKVNPDNSPLISLVQKPLASSTSPVLSAGVINTAVLPSAAEDEDRLPSPVIGRGGSHRGVKSFESAMRGLAMEGAAKSTEPDPFAPDEEGVRPFCLAVKSPNQMGKYLVHWLRPDYTTDVYQVGREPGPGVDMVVPGASYLQPIPTGYNPPTPYGPSPPYNPHQTPILLTSAQPRFPFRLVCSRAKRNPGSPRKSSSNWDVRLFAGAFDGAGRLILGSKDLRFVDDLGRVDALVGNSVLVWRPDWTPPPFDLAAGSQGEEGAWVEVSAVHGSPYALRSDPAFPGKRLSNPEWGFTDGREGVSLGEEAIIYAGGTCFLWKKGDGKEEELWTFREFSEMLKELEEKVVCPVTLDTIHTDHVAESIRGRSLKPWDRLVARLRWLNSAAPPPVPSKHLHERDILPAGTNVFASPFESATSAHHHSEGFFSASSLISEGEEEVATRRPWVFIECGHVVSFMDIPSFNRSASNTQNPLHTPCFVCRTPSRFIPLIARLNPHLLTARATHCFDPCGHMVHAEGAERWGRRVVVPRVGRDPRVWDSEPVCGPAKANRPPAGSAGLHGSMSGRAGGVGGSTRKVGWGWCHMCPFCAVEVTAVRKLYWSSDE